MLTHRQAREFYDHFGSRQDAQAYYEDEPCRKLILAGGFATAKSILEFGCGTGRFARELLDHHLPTDATYLGLDLSLTMLNLARGRLAGFEDRVSLAHTDGAISLDCPSQQVDRVVSNYVLDLLSEADITQFLKEAKRVLHPEGRLCLVNLTFGPTWPTWVASTIWTLVHRLSPRRVGGCRPLDVTPFLKTDSWEIRFKEVVIAGRLASQVLVATPRNPLKSAR